MVALFCNTNPSHEIGEFINHVFNLCIIMRPMLTVYFTMEYWETGDIYYLFNSVSKIHTKWCLIPESLQEARTTKTQTYTTHIVSNAGCQNLNFFIFLQIWWETYLKFHIWMQNWILNTNIKIETPDET